MIDTTGIADELDYEVTDNFFEKHIPCKKARLGAKDCPRGGQYKISLYLFPKCSTFLCICTFFDECFFDKCVFWVRESLLDQIRRGLG